MRMSALISGRRSLLYVTGCGIAACVLWAAIWLALQTAQDQSIAEANLDGRNLARSLSEHVEATVRVIDLSLLTLREEWHNGPQAFGAAVARQREFLKRESITHVGVAGANGIAAWDTTPGWKPVDISDRDYFRFHRQRGADDQLHISEPLQGRISGQATIQFTRPIYDGQQRFAGVLDYSLSPPALEQVYMDLKPGEGGNISLVRADGKFLARSRNFLAALGHSLPQSTTPGLRPGDPESADYRAISEIENIDSLFSYYKVPSYPLVLYVRQPVATVLAPYYALRTNYVIGGTLMTALLLAATLLLLWRRHDREAAEKIHAANEAALRESNERFGLVANAVNAVVWSSDPAVEKTLYVSPSYERVWGRTVQSLQENPQTFIDAIHPDDRQRVLEHLKLQNAGLPLDHEYRIVLPDGSMRWIWDRGSPVPGDLPGTVRHYVGLALDISRRKRADELRENLLKRLDLLSEHLSIAQENERRTIAYELHDQLGQELTTLRLHLQMLGNRADAIKSEAHFQEALTLADSLQERMSSLALSTAPLQLEDLGLSEALRTHCAQQAAAQDVTIHVDAPDMKVRAPLDVEKACFRMAQETLNNVQRHAHASDVWVSLHESGGELTLSVRDNGIGFDVAAILDSRGNRGLGLLAIEQRARRLGGRMAALSSPGAGTQIDVVFPLQTVAA